MGHIVRIGNQGVNVQVVRGGLPGPAGPAGADGTGLPDGGTTGQILTKQSNDDQDADWETVAGTGDMQASVYDPTAIADDAFDRANHTGAQAISTVTGLQTALDAKLTSADINSLAELNAIIADATLIDTADSRLSDARTPTSHATSHQSGGSDEIKLDDLAAPDDNTDLDATTGAHGLFAKLDKTKLDGIESGATADQSGAELAANIDIQNATPRSAFASGDKFLIWEDGVGNRQVDYDDLPGSGGGISNVVEDTSPQSGGAWDTNNFEIISIGGNDITLHSDNNAIVRLGDDAGADKLAVQDSGDAEVLAVDSNGNVTLAGTVDGRDVAADGSKLDTIESSAKDDQSAAEVPVTPSGNLASTDVQAALVEHQGDIDTINTSLGGLTDAVTLQGTWDASSGSFPGGGTAQAGYSYIVSVGGTVDSVVFNINDRILAITDNASAATFSANWHKLDYTDEVLSVNSQTGAVTLTHTDVGAQQANANLSAIAGLTTIADRLSYWTGSATAALATLTAFGRSLVAAVDAAAVRTLLALGNAALATIGTGSTNVAPGNIGQRKGSVSATTATTNVSLTDIDWAEVTLQTATTALGFTNAVDGKVYRVKLLQDGTGGRQVTAGTGLNVGSDVAMASFSGDTANKWAWIAVIGRSSGGVDLVTDASRGFS